MSAKEEAAKANPEGRDASGRFAKGNGGGPGNPYARRVAQMRCLMLHMLTGEDLVAIGVAMIDRAKAGDVAAARLVLQYTLGRPAENPHPDRIEADELEAFRANTMRGDLRPDFTAVPLGPALEVMRATNEGMADVFWREFVAAFGPGGEADRRAAAAAVTKREMAGQPMTTDAPPGHAAATAETTHQATPPGAAAPHIERRAANRRRP